MVSALLLRSPAHPAPLSTDGACSIYSATAVSNRRIACTNAPWPATARRAARRTSHTTRRLSAEPVVPPPVQTSELSCPVPRPSGVCSNPSGYAPASRSVRTSARCSGTTSATGVRLRRLLQICQLAPPLKRADLRDPAERRGHLARRSITGGRDPPLGQVVGSHRGSGRDRHVVRESAWVSRRWPGSTAVLFERRGGAAAGEVRHRDGVGGVGVDAADRLAAQADRTHSGPFRVSLRSSRSRPRIDPVERHEMAENRHPRKD